MRKGLLILGVVLTLAMSAVGQESFIRPSISSTAPNTLRHEIVQVSSSQMLNLTLRLDKYTGRVFFLTSCPLKNIIGTGLCWKETTVLELPKPTSDNTVRFQIFGQGEASRNILLINNVTGQTWQLGIEDGLYKWTPLLDSITLPQSFEIVR